MITPLEKIVKSSIQVYMADPAYMKPQGFGSGFIFQFDNEKFFVSVSHVTSGTLQTFLETNIIDEENRPIYKPVGGLMYFDVLKFSKDINARELEEVLNKKGDRLDITFARIESPYTLIQPELKFPIYTVNEGPKFFIDESEITTPNKESLYGFYGKVKPDFQNNTVVMRPTLKNDLTFHRKKGVFDIFLSPNLIKDSEDYQGCSGAPILDYEGNIVSIACAVWPNTKMIYGFSIQECLRLLKIALSTKQI